MFLFLLPPLVGGFRDPLGAAASEAPRGFGDVLSRAMGMDRQPLFPIPLCRAPIPIPGWEVGAVPLSHVLLLMKREPLKATKPRRRLGGSGVGTAMNSSRALLSPVRLSPD